MLRLWFSLRKVSPPSASKSLPVEGFYVELNLCKKKWLVCCSYNPEKSKIKDCLQTLSVNLDICSPSYDNYIVSGAFNVENDNNDMKDFGCNYNLRSLDSVSTRYKNPGNSFLCIVLILKTSRGTFGSSCAVESGSSDFPKMIVTVMTLHKKWSFPQRISSVNVTKSAGNCGKTLVENFIFWAVWNHISETETKRRYYKKYMKILQF